MEAQAIETNGAVRDRLRAFLAARGKGSAVVADALRRSKRSIGDYLDGSFRGDAARLEAQFKKFLDTEELSPSIKWLPEFAMTTAAEEIFGLAHAALTERLFVLIWGQAGVGKTEALREYAACEPDVVYIEANAASTCGSIIAEVAKALDLNKSGRAAELTEEIVGRLRGSHKMLVFDEGDYLGIRCVEWIRQLRDAADVGIVLCGMPPFYALLKSGDCRHQFGQVWSRLDLTFEARPATLDDIHKILPDATGKVLSLVHKAAQGIPRTAVKLWQGASRLASANGGEVTKELLLHVVEGD